MKPRNNQLPNINTQATYADGRTTFGGTSLVTALAFWALLVAGQATAQDQIHSEDLTKQWQSIAENLSAAQAADQRADAQTTNYLAGAEAAKARANDTNLTPQARYEG